MSLSKGEPPDEADVVVVGAAEPVGAAEVVAAGEPEGVTVALADGVAPAGATGCTSMTWRNLS